jgi:hypothetical protein
MPIIFGKHDGCNKEFCWYISKRKSEHVEAGDLLLVETKKGLQIATAMTSPIYGNEICDIKQMAELNGASFPLKRVVSFANKAMRDYILIGYKCKVLNNIYELERKINNE